MRRWFRYPRGWAGRGTSPRPGDDWATTQLERRGITDPDVLRVMRSVPRERFVPKGMERSAYDDGAMPIGHGQTISQPYIVASMTQSMALPQWSAAHDGARAKVLDVGTGSGYQAAVLAAMGAQVVSIEREAALADDARSLLAELGYKVKVVVGDGSAGAPDDAPFAAIVVAAASPEIPVPLVDQLLPDGRLVIPIGTRFDQVITLVRPTDDGFTREPLEPALFVPLVGEHGFAE